MVFSSSAVQAGIKYHRPYYYLLQQAIGAVAGLVLLGPSSPPIRKPFLRDPYVVYGLLALSAFLLMLCFVMPTVARTNRWIQLFGVRFQPSELAKISLVLFFAWYGEAKREKLNEWKTLAVPAAVLFAFVILIVMEPNYSMAVFIAGLSAVMLFLARRAGSGTSRSSAGSAPSCSRPTSSRPATGWSASRASSRPRRTLWARASRSSSRSSRSARAASSGRAWARARRSCSSSRSPTRTSSTPS